MIFNRTEILVVTLLVVTLLVVLCSATLLVV